MYAKRQKRPFPMIKLRAEPDIKAAFVLTDAICRRATPGTSILMFEFYTTAKTACTCPG
jgi:hypothetical protein